MIPCHGSDAADTALHRLCLWQRIQAKLQKGPKLRSTFFWVVVAADVEAVAPRISSGSQGFVIVQAGIVMGTVEPSADAASSQERMSTPKHDRAMRGAN